MAGIVPAVVTVTFFCTTNGEFLLVTPVNAPVMFRSRRPALRPVMLTLLRLTFRMQDSGRPTMTLSAVAPVAVRPEMVMSRIFGVSAVIACGGS